ncbi:MAG: NAD(P)/FAD-dependent oxidoreductase [Candidatus Acidiferrales bacterium]
MNSLSGQNSHTKSQSHATSQKLPVAVVGGSAAGFFTASLLAQRGIPVQVFERAETLEPISRTLIVTHKLRTLLGRAAAGSVVNEIRRFELFTDGRAAKIQLNEPDLIIERSTLIRGLADEARRAGAEITLGRRFHGLHSNGAGLVLDVERSADGAREEVRTQTVVGSDGAASRVAQSAGWPRQETVPLVQAIVELPKDMPAETVRVWFVPDDTPYFYWLIPDSASRGVLGLIGESGQETRKHLERFLEKRHLEPTSFQGARIPVYNRWVPVKRRVGAGDVYLVGDAAAQVKVTTVGGIVTGFRGALGVAESIVNRGESPELRRLRRELDMHLLLRRSLHHFQQSDYSRLVDLLNDSARRSLSDYSRDEALKVIWHICLSQPRLLLMGLRGLLTGGRTFAPPSRP